MADKVNIDLDEAFLKKFFALTDKVIEDGQEITLSILRRQLDEIETILKEAQGAAGAAKGPSVPSSFSSSSSSEILPDSAPSGSSLSSDDDEDEFNLPQKNILIIDDLGVITYQLSVIFKQSGFDVVTSKEIYDAIEKFKKQSFDLVIMDLFIPTEREGLILLEELKKVAASRRKPTKIGVMSASPKKEHKQLCKMKGAEFYIEKVDEWQKELFRVITEIKP